MLIKFFALTGLIALGAATLSADVVSTFSIDGTLTLTSNSFAWQLSSAPFTAGEAVIGPGANGIYTALDGTDVTINAFTFSTPLPFDFMSFPAAPSLSHLDLTGALPGFGSSGACAQTPPAAGQMCSPPGSPFTFINTTNHSTSVDFDLIGVTADGTGTWEGDFSTQFAESYQALLTTLAASNGSATSTYSATFTVHTPTTATPEPASIGASLVGLAFVALRARKTHRTQ